MCFIVFIPRPVTTSFDRFFAVAVHSSCVLKLSGTGPVRGPSKKGNRTETGPDFKALYLTPMSKRVSIATPELRSFGDSEMSCVNGRGFNFDVAPSFVGIWGPLISRVGDVRGSE